MEVMRWYSLREKGFNRLVSILRKKKFFFFSKKNEEGVIF